MEDNRNLSNWAPTTAKKIRKSTLDFLSSLNSNQKKKVTFEFDSTNERYEWNYTPVDRNGLLMSEMNQKQVNLLLNIMEKCYSPSGYKTAIEIIDLEKILGEWESILNHKSRFVRDPKRYWVRVFGDPNKSLNPFSVRVGGHHIGLIATVVDQKVSTLPLFFGANPSEIKHGENKGTKTLLEEEEWARNLVSDIGNEYKEKIIFSPIAPDDILTASFSNIRDISIPTGISFKELPDGSRQELVNLIKHYIFRSNNETAENYWDQIKAQSFDSVNFSWAGSLNPGEGHYYSIKHQRFLIEYDNTQNNANHIHSVLRDFNGDYGLDILGDHYKANHN